MLTQADQSMRAQPYLRRIHHRSTGGFRLQQVEEGTCADFFDFVVVDAEECDDNEISLQRQPNTAATKQEE